MNRSIIITGANTGIGKEAARQLALLDETDRIYLACRSEKKALVAKTDLEKRTGKTVFEIIVLDLADLHSVRRAVLSLEEPVDALLMNGGGGGKNPLGLTRQGTTEIFATNVLGHALLLEEMLRNKKLTKTAVYVGSEAARGIPKMHMPRPGLTTSSVDEFDAIITGLYFLNRKPDMALAYGQVKYMGALWLSFMARKHPMVRMITMSPGSTRGTGTADNFPPIHKFIYKHLLMPVLFPLMGMSHKLQTGAGRLVDALNNPVYRGGLFYGSKESVLTGPVVDQSTIFADLKNATYQDNAHKAISRYLQP